MPKTRKPETEATAPETRPATPARKKPKATPAKAAGIARRPAAMAASSGRKAAGKLKAQPAAAPEPLALYEEVARLAYSYWESRGGQGGDPQEDWYRAEQEVLRRRAAAGE